MRKILLIFAFVSVMLIPACSSNESDTTTDANSSINGNVIVAGTYKIGEDLPAGEYVIYHDEESSYMPYYEISSDSTGDSDSRIDSANVDVSRYITVKDGQYLKLEGLYAYKEEDAPQIDLSKPGMYKVGKDIDAGEYKIVEYEDSTYCKYYCIVTSSDPTEEERVDSGNFEGSVYVTLKEGQYLLVDAGIIEQNN